MAGLPPLAGPGLSTHQLGAAVGLLPQSPLAPSCLPWARGCLGRGSPASPLHPSGYCFSPRVVHQELPAHSFPKDGDEGNPKSHARGIQDTIETIGIDVGASAPGQAMAAARSIFSRQREPGCSAAPEHELPSGGQGQPRGATLGSAPLSGGCAAASPTVCSPRGQRRPRGHAAETRRTHGHRAPGQTLNARANAPRVRR